MFLVVFALRWSVRATVPTEWDSALLLQGVDKFDVTHMSPHPPGSFLYVQLGHVLHDVFGFGRQTALVLLSALASSGAAAIAFLIGNTLRSKWLGLLLAVCVLTNPIVAFYGSIVATYSFDLLGGMALILLALHARKYWWTAPLALTVVGLAAGFRTNAFVFDMPIALFVVWRSHPSKRVLLISGAAGVLSVIAWLIPLSLMQPGGISAWREASGDIFEHAMNGTSAFFAPWESASKNIGVVTAYSVIALIVFVPALVVGLAGRILERVRLSTLERDALVACALLAVPSFVFAALGHWGKAGYLLMFFAGLVVPLAVLWSQLSLRWLAAAALLAVGGSTFQTQRFVAKAGILPGALVNKGPWFTQEAHWAPFPETLTARRNAEAQTKDVLSALAEVEADSRDAVIMLDGDNGDRYAHVAWTFPTPKTFYIHHASLWTNTAQNHTWNVHAGKTRIPVDDRDDLWVITKTERGDLRQLADRGLAERVFFNDHAVVWRAQPCTRIANAILERNDCAEIAIPG